MGDRSADARGINGVRRVPEKPVRHRRRGTAVAARGERFDAQDGGLLAQLAARDVSTRRRRGARARRAAGPRLSRREPRRARGARLGEPPRRSPAERRRLRASPPSSVAAQGRRASRSAAPSTLTGGTASGAAALGPGSAAGPGPGAAAGEGDGAAGTAGATCDGVAIREGDEALLIAAVSPSPAPTTTSVCRATRVSCSRSRRHRAAATATVAVGQPVAVAAGQRGRRRDAHAQGDASSTARVEDRPRAQTPAACAGGAGVRVLLVALHRVTRTSLRAREPRTISARISNFSRATKPRRRRSPWARRASRRSPRSPSLELVQHEDRPQIERQRVEQPVERRARVFLLGALVAVESRLARLDGTARAVDADHGSRDRAT